MRQTENRLLRTNYVVLGDGQSEQYYLKHLKKLKNYKYAIRPSLFASITIETAENIIDELLSGGCNQIIYFTDYDTIIAQGKQQQFDTLKNKYANRTEVLICESMPSIEFWFLLHFQKTTREYSMCHRFFSIEHNKKPF
jgi:RloB-like protein